MDKRVLLTVVICFGILFVWTKFFVPTPPPHPTETAAPTAPATAPAEKPGEAQKTPAAPEAVKGGVAVAPKSKETAEKPAKPAVRPPEKIASVVRPERYHAEFTTWGAAPKSWTLLKPHYKEFVTQPDGKKVLAPIDLVKSSGADLPLTLTFPQSDVTLAPDAAWTQLPSGPNELVYAVDEGALHVEKHYTLPEKGYEMKLKVIVENRGDKALTERLQMAMYGWQDPNVKTGGFFSGGRYSIHTSGMCDVAGKLHDGDLEALLKKPIDESGMVRFIAIDERYFVAALVVQPNEERSCSLGANPDGLVTVTLLDGPKQLAPSSKTEYDYVGFFGPKILNQLDAVKVNGVDAKLGDSINYGWTEAIARPMLAVLKAVYIVIPNWGLAIVVITILLKAITWWPNAKSIKSMRGMAKLKPEMDKIKEKFGNDKQKMNVAVMALYKEHGINPLGGCLPMLIQFPIYIALYAMLGNSVELYRSPFLWMHDLTAPDPYYILPVLTGVLMFVQQWVSPTSPDGQQQKMMMYMMPLMYAAFSLFFPAGLTIYILISTLLTLMQTWWMYRGEPRKKKSPAAAPAKA
jgi:YidC/Oxa1 family membrane protein insertase